MGRRRKNDPPPTPKDPRRNAPWDPKPPVKMEVKSMFAECPAGHVNYRFEVERGICKVCE